MSALSEQTQALIYNKIERESKPKRGIFQSNKKYTLNSPRSGSPLLFVADY